MIEQDNDEQVIPRASEHIAAILDGRGQGGGDGDGPKIQISLRVPILELAFVDGLAANLGKSRNATFSMLLEVAQEEIRSQMSVKAAKALNLAMKDRAKAMAPDHVWAEGNGFPDRYIDPEAR